MGCPKLHEGWVFLRGGEKHPLFPRKPREKNRSRSASAEMDGGWNLYGMVGNDPVGRWDWRGLVEATVKLLNDSGKIIASPDDIGISNDANISGGMFISPDTSKAKKDDIQFDKKTLKICTVKLYLRILIKENLKKFEEWRKARKDDDVLANRKGPVGRWSGLRVTYHLHTVGSDGIGTIENGFYEVVLAHEKGHAQAFIDYFTQTAKKKILDEIKKGYYIEDNLRRKVLTIIRVKNYDRESGTKANKATIHFMDKHPNFKKAYLKQREGGWAGAKSLTLYSWQVIK